MHSDNNDYDYDSDDEFIYGLKPSPFDSYISSHIVVGVVFFQLSLVFDVIDVTLYISAIYALILILGHMINKRKVPYVMRWVNYIIATVLYMGYITLCKNIIDEHLESYYYVVAYLAAMNLLRLFHSQILSLVDENLEYQMNIIKNYM